MTKAQPSSEFFSPQHKAARYWANRGFFVFPCLPHAKQPAVKDWKNQATTDAEAVDRLWERHPEANIGCAPDASGCFVIDIDTKGAKNGYDTLADLQFEHGQLPETLRVETPSGGLHLWLRGTGVTTVQKLGAGIDTRGQGGYVLLPGSKLPQGEYKFLSRKEIAPAPEWISTALKREIHHDKADTDTEIDSEVNIRRAISLLQQKVREGDVAIEGRGGDDKTYRLAVQLRDFGLSEHTVFQLLFDNWNGHCSPPWEQDDLERKVENAFEYGQNETGSQALQDAGTVFANVPVPVLSPKKKTKSRFKILSEAEQDKLQPPEWLVDNWLPTDATAMLIGPWGSYKSFLMAELAFSRAAGLPFYGLPATSACPVVYAAGEGAVSIAKKRRPAWKHAREITAGLPFWLLQTVPQASPEDLQAFVDALDAAKIKPGVIILDTAARAMLGMDENSAQDAGKLIEACDTLKTIFSPCLVIAVHHTGHGDKTRARGSSAFGGGFDVLLHVEADKDAKIVKLICDKQKDAEEPDPLFLAGRSVKQSLIFEPIEEKEAHKLTAGEEAIKRERVGEALRALKAFGDVNAIATRVLASKMAELDNIQHETAELEKKYLDLMEKRLRKLASARLESYLSARCDGNLLLWCLPSNQA